MLTRALSLDVIVRRGEIRECRHRIHAAVLDSRGALVASAGRHDLVTSFRSAAKPFQALPLVERGHADALGLGPEELAILVASHTGSALHRSLAAGILGRIGRTERDLVCGFHEPDDPEALAEVRARPEWRSALYNNCSGKHAGLLALAQREGWPMAGYERPEHPVQQLMRQTVAECCGLPPEALEVGVDGCGIVVFGLPLTSMARGYLRLTQATAEVQGRDNALSRIRRAMTRHPMIVEGAGRLSTALMEVSGGRLVAKCGAEGLQLVGDIERGLALALKCEDGATRATGPATVAALLDVGMLSRAEADALEAFRTPVLKNAAQDVVGVLELQSLEPTPPA